jgi:large subunit ribosomal protein L17
MSRHMMRGRQLSRDTEHRKALRRNMAQSLFEHGKIRTTLPKAKEVQGFIEKLITLSRSNTLINRRRVIQLMQDRRLVDKEQEFITEGSRTVVEKLFNDIGPKFADRAGGYTRIIKLAKHRIGDGGSLVQLQLLTEETGARGSVRRSAGLRRKRNERRHQFAGTALKRDKGTAPAATEAAAPESPATEQPGENA